MRVRVVTIVTVASVCLVALAGCAKKPAKEALAEQPTEQQKADMASKMMKAGGMGGGAPKAAK